MDFIFEFQKATSRFELETDSLFMALEMCDMRHDDMIRRANYKIFCESGTYEDALYLYEEANAETNEQKEGIITRIVNWITEQLAKLKTFLFGNKKTEKAKEKLESPDAPDSKEVNAPELPGGHEEYMKDQEKWLDKVIKWAKGVPVVGDIIEDKKKTIGAAITFGVAATGKELVEYFLNEKLYTLFGRKIDEANKALNEKLEKSKDEKEKKIATSLLKTLRGITSGISQLTGWALKTANTWVETEEKGKADIDELRKKISELENIDPSNRTEKDNENLAAYRKQFDKMNKSMKTVSKYANEERKSTEREEKRKENAKKKDIKKANNTRKKIAKKKNEEAENSDNSAQEPEVAEEETETTSKSNKNKGKKKGLFSKNKVKSKKSKSNDSDEAKSQEDTEDGTETTEESWFDFDVDGEYMSEFDNDILDDELDDILSNL